MYIWSTNKQNENLQPPTDFPFPYIHLRDGICNPCKSDGMNPIMITGRADFSRCFDKLKIAEAVNNPHDSVYYAVYRDAMNDPATIDQAIRDMAAQIKSNEVVMRGIIGNKAVDLIKKYNHE